MTATSTEKLLVDLDASIDALASEAKVDALNSILAEDFMYTHSTGKTQNRQEWTDSLIPLTGKRTRVVSNGEAEVHGDVAVVRGDLDIAWNDDRPVATDRYVRVYRLQDGQWRAISQRTVLAHDRQHPSS
jgi:ketosteroid isomerase-like protein